jgi:hypothetical protein
LRAITVVFSLARASVLSVLTSSFVHARSFTVLPFIDVLPPAKSNQRIRSDSYKNTAVFEMTAVDNRKAMPGQSGLIGMEDPHQRISPTCAGKDLSRVEYTLELCGLRERERAKEPPFALREGYLDRFGDQESSQATATAVVKSRGGGRCGKPGTRSRLAGPRKAPRCGSVESGLAHV